MRRFELALVALVLTGSFAGCLDGANDLDLPDGPAGVFARVLRYDQTPAAYAGITALDNSGTVVLTLSADRNGIFSVLDLPGQTLIVTAPGHEPWKGPLGAVPATLTLGQRVLPLEADGLDPILQFLPPVYLGTTALARQEATCAAYNCGASEPSVEVAGDGTIYATGVCCVGQSPPIWVSRDGGTRFTPLRGDVLRENFGIEGDFAIDDAGNLYFTDISVAGAYIASWDKTGTHRWTVPLGPFVPIVDRPWVRAGPENHVYFLYNQGTKSLYYLSTDGGRTWMLEEQFPAGLGGLAQGRERAHLWVAAGERLYESTDEGRTWTGGSSIPMPNAEGNRFMAFQNVVVDETGRVFVVYDFRLKNPPESLTDPKDDVPYHVYVSRRDADGSWHKPFQVSPVEGTHHLPWAATGKGGTLSLAWYGTLDEAKGPDGVSEKAKWFLFAATSHDAVSETPHFQVAIADPEPVHKGPMNRKLLDFLQIDLGPEGAMHIAYAQDRLGQEAEVTQFVRSTIGLQLQPSHYPNGPTL